MKSCKEVERLLSGKFGHMLARMAAWRSLVPVSWRLCCREVSSTQKIGHENGQYFATRRWYSQPWTAPYDAGQPTSESHPQMLSGDELFPGISLRDFKERRTALRSRLPTESMVILSAASVKQMTDVVPYPFRQDADYLYYTGSQQPEGIAVLYDDADLCMFMPNWDPERETWNGKLAGPDEASRVFGADVTHSLRRLRKVLPDIIRRAKTVFCDLGSLTPVVAELEAFQSALQQGRVRSLNRYSHQQRWVKSPSELNLMREAASITCKAVKRSMQASRAWQHEHLLAATVEYECKRRGAQQMAFPSVVGGGANGSIVHYSRHDKKIDNEALVLMDVGCEYHGYVSDMTRTWPPCGYFTDAKKQVYTIILDVMKECFKMCRPGVTLSQIHSRSVALLWEGLLKLGLVTGPFDLFKFYSFNRTQIGHYLGMDVHDCSTVSLDRPLQPGVVITIEPGLYIPAKQTIPEKFRGIGIRIEDEVLITATGYEILTAEAPKEIEEIEQFLAQSPNDNDLTEKPSLFC